MRGPRVRSPPRSPENLTNVEACPMARASRIGVVFLFAVCSQTLVFPSSVGAQVSTSNTGHRDQVVSILLHTSSIPTDDMIDVLRAALQDEDPQVRELALAAIMSRTAGVRLVNTPQSQSE